MPMMAHRTPIERSKVQLEHMKLSLEQTLITLSDLREAVCVVREEVERIYDQSLNSIEHIRECIERIHLVDGQLTEYLNQLD